ncbi:MAG: SatD family protein [Ornithinibacter sp.]
MDQMMPPPSPCVLIGDLVSSRKAPDRARLHEQLEAALTAVDAAVAPLTALRVTAGDEFQGTYATLGGAVDAALRVRLALLPEADARFGLGRGETAVLDRRRGIEDGPGWWAARAGIEQVAAMAERSATRQARTAFRAAVPDPVEAAVNAALLCRDHLVGSMSPRSLRLLKGLMDSDSTQREIAAREGISASAVSQRVRADGIGAVLEAQQLLRGLP